MKDIVLLYDDCCIYEIVALNYFLRFTGSDVCFCGLGKGIIRAMEGYSINVDGDILDVDLSQVRSFILPGGAVRHIDTPEVRGVIQKLHEQGTLIAGICAGVDVLDRAGILTGILSTHSTEADCIRDGNVITSRANGYIDFAIETAKALNLFQSEQDLQETVDFWKRYKRMQ